MAYNRFSPANKNTFTPGDSFHGIQSHPYIDLRTGILHEYMFSDERKLKVAEAVLPVFIELCESFSYDIDLHTKKKEALERVLNEVEQYALPASVCMQNLKAIQTKLGGIAKIEYEKMMDSSTPSVILRSFEAIPPAAEQAKKIFDFMTDANLFQFNNSGHVAHVWCEGHVQPMQIKSEFDDSWKWNFQSPVYIGLSEKERAQAFEMFELLMKVASQLRHFYLYTPSGHLEVKCQDFASLRTNYQLMKNTIVEREGRLKQELRKKYSNESDLLRVLERDATYQFYKAPREFLEKFTPYIERIDQLEKVQHDRHMVQKRHQIFQSSMQYMPTYAPVEYSVRENVKENQETIVHEAMEQPFKELVALLWSKFIPSPEVISFFQSVYSAKDPRNKTNLLYGVSVQKIIQVVNMANFPVKITEKLTMEQKKAWQDRLGAGDIPRERWEYSMQEFLQKPDAPVIRDLCVLSAAVQLIELLAATKHEDGTYTLHEGMKKIYAHIALKAQKAQMNEDLIYLSLFELFSSILSEILMSAGKRIEAEKSTIPVNLSAHMKAQLGVSQVNQEQLKEMRKHIEEDIDDIQLELKAHAKYRDIFQEIIERITKKRDAASSKMVSEDVQKSIGAYRKQHNQAPKNNPVKDDWDWMLDIVKKGTKEGLTGNIEKMIHTYVRENYNVDISSREQYVDLNSIQQGVQQSVQRSTTGTVSYNKSAGPSSSAQQAQATMTAMDLLKNGVKKYKELTAEQQKAAMAELMSSADSGNTQTLTQYGITSGDIMQFVMGKK